MINLTFSMDIFEFTPRDIIRASQKECLCPIFPISQATFPVVLYVI